MSRWVHDGLKAVFFDAVGTLIFPEPGAATVYAQAASRRGIVVDVNALRERMWTAYRAEEKVDRIAGWVTSESREAARWRRIVSDSLPDGIDAENCFQELFAHFAQPTSWRVNPDADRVFSTLRQRGVTLGLASNYDARLLSVIAGHPELGPIRDRVVISAAVGYRKPAREFFEHVVQAAGCEAHEILFVGDDVENDYVGATAAGMKAVLLETHPAKPECPVPVENRIASLGELIR